MSHGNLRLRRSKIFRLAPLGKSTMTPCSGSVSNAELWSKLTNFPCLSPTETWSIIEVSAKSVFRRDLRCMQSKQKCDVQRINPASGSLSARNVERKKPGRTSTKLTRRKASQLSAGNVSSSRRLHTGNESRRMLSLRRLPQHFRLPQRLVQRQCLS